MVNAARLLRSIGTAQLSYQQVLTDYDIAFKFHFDCSVSVQAMCRQFTTEEEGSEDKKDWYSSLSTLNVSSSHSLLLHHLHYKSLPFLTFALSLPNFYVYIMININ